MRYQDVDSLPQAIRENLPRNAQEVYANAFNNKYEQVQDEQLAHEAARTAVNDQFDDANARQWQRKDGRAVDSRLHDDSVAARVDQPISR